MTNGPATVFLTSEHWRSIKMIRDQAKLVIMAWEEAQGSHSGINRKLQDRLITLRHVLEQEVQG